MELNPILAPAAVLILWSLVVLLWLIATRFPAFAKAGVDLKNTPRGGRYVDVEPDMPERVNWVSHNYTHLMEQPTLYYAVIMVLAIAGDSSEVNLMAAWAYTGLRILHSLWQNLVNVVPVRVVLFALSSISLMILAVNAVLLTLGM